MRQIEGMLDCRQHGGAIWSKLLADIFNTTGQQRALVGAGRSHRMHTMPDSTIVSSGSHAELGLAL
jgi:hypothetical protein